MIFRYCGGKNKKSIREKILSKAPLFYSSYREPFIGGGGIFWQIDTGVERWINDLDKDLISVYLALRERPEDFIKKCREIKPAEKNEPLTSSRPGGKEIYNKRLKEVFDDFLTNPNTDRALKYFFFNRTNWGGRTDYTRPSRMYFSNPSGWNIVKKDALEKAAQLLKNVRITNEDYNCLLEEPGNDVFAYLDPPYLVNTGFNDGSLLYRHNFTIEDHTRLAQNVQKCPHKVLLSYDDDKDGIIRGLYSGANFNIYEEEWTYCGTSSSEEVKNKKKKIGKELIITNYKR